VFWFTKLDKDAEQSLNWHDHVNEVWYFALLKRTDMLSKRNDVFFFSFAQAFWFVYIERGLYGR
jgi:hypothetical protein